ncbi:MAG TPA: cellulose binding domain-containing protein [Polyangiaceae bacterium]
MMKKLLHALGLGMALLLASSSALAAITVQFKDNDGTPTSEWMRLEFKIVNGESTPFDLSNTTLRYYFRDTGKTWSTALWSFLIDSNPTNMSSITPSVVPEPSLTDGWVLTLKFSSGTISANSDCWVLVGAHSETWSVNELDDYSYMSGPVLLRNEYVSLYQQDVRIFGPQLFELPPSRAVFAVMSNPIISFDNRQHYSSDPVVSLIPGLDGDMLYLATSTDQDIASDERTDWPMDGIHLYSTSGPNPANVQWFEYGNLNSKNNIDAVLSLSDFVGADAKQRPRNMFAPDIQYVQYYFGEPEGKMYMYIPLPTNSSGWQIATASADVDSDGSVGTFTQSSTLFRLSGASSHPMASPIDPGVFPQVDSAYGLPNASYFMLYVDLVKGQSENPKAGNISLARLNSDMVSGSYVGKIRFASPYTNYTKLINFMEGPDVTVMRSKSGKSRYYMVFSADDDGGTTSLIGYAMADVKCFEDYLKDPQAQQPENSCWHFKGWIFQSLGTGNNHANLIQIGDRYYIFYHRGYTTSGYHRRQVWAKEIALIDNPKNSSWLPEDGEIVGVARPPSSATETLARWGSLNGTTSWITKDTRYIRNAIRGDDNVWSYVTVAEADPLKEGVGINERALERDSVNQEWFIEDIGGTKVGNITAPSNAVMIRNRRTPDKRMTCGDTYGSPTEGTANYGLFNKKLETDNTKILKQVWLKEEVSYGISGTYKLRNLWRNNSSDPLYYLTRNVATGDSDTFCKTAVSDERKQIWFIE